MRLVDNIFNSMVGKGKTAPYVYYDYLENDGNGQFIDTAMMPNQDTDIEIDYFSLLALTSNLAQIFGGQNHWRNGSFRVLFYNRRLVAVFGTSEMNTGYGPSSLGHAMTFAKQGSSITAADVDAGTTFSGTISSATYTCPYNLALFACKDRDGTWTAGRVRFGKVRVKQSGTLVRDFRPAVRIADGVAGMHDVVNDVFYTNANPAGDNFLYGNLT